MSAGGRPTGNVDITIDEGAWVVLDVEDLPEFNRIFIFGVLEFDVQGAQDLKLSATHIFISGGRLIMGWPVRGKL